MKRAFLSRGAGEQVSRGSRGSRGSRAMLGIVFSVLLLGCSSPTPARSPIATPSPQVESVNLGQTLPISAQATIAGHTIGLEVARTPEQQATGLMYRSALGDYRGMLFKFESPQVARFWMKNVRIPLDMIFLQDGEVKAMAASVPPCTTSPCPSYGPETLINQVIELRGGRAAELGLKVGEQVKIKFLDSERSQH